MDPLDDRSHIPPILFTSPRRLRRVKGIAAPGDGCGRIFILPHVLVGIGALLVILGYPIWAIFGSDSMAHVVSAWTQKGSKGSTSYYVEYERSIEGHTKRSKETVSEAEFHRVGGGATGVETPGYKDVRIRQLGSPPWGYAAIVEQAKGPWMPYLFIVLWGGFWNTVVGIFAWQFYIRPLVVRGLYRTGVPDPGRVTGKRSEKVKNGWSYYVDYEFKLASGEHRKASVAVAKQTLADIVVGQPLTILHPPGRTKPSVPYELGGYACT